MTREQVWTSAGLYLVLAACGLSIESTRLRAQTAATAVVVDLSGTETALSPVRTSVNDFAGYKVEGLGISLITKRFMRAPLQPPAGDLEEWFFFTQFSRLDRNAERAQIHLADGSTLEGQLNMPMSVGGKFALGQLDLLRDKLKSLTITQPGSRPAIAGRGADAPSLSCEMHRHLPSMILLCIAWCSLGISMLHRPRTLSQRCGEGAAWRSIRQDGSHV